MQVINNESLMAFDVDNTLVTKIPNTSFNQHDESHLKIMNPYTGIIESFKVHLSHINLLKEQFHRGRMVVVWSASGYRWSQAVVLALDLEKYVSLVCTKFIGYVDDKPIDSWIGQAIFVKEGER